MTKPTDAEMIEALEDLIQTYKYARYRPENPDYAAYHTLRALAADLRARNPGAVSVAQRGLQEAIDACLQSKTAMGYENGRLCRVAQELIGRWPTVRQALERFEKADASV